MDINDFLSAEKPKKPSKLSAFEQQILELYNIHKIGYEGICRFLAANGVKADRAEVYRYIKRKCRSDKGAQKIKQEPIATNPESTENSDTPETEKPKGFNWNEQSTKEVKW
jgi:hypothetical protein